MVFKFYNFIFNLLFLLNYTESTYLKNILVIEPLKQTNNKRNDIKMLDFKAFTNLDKFFDLKIYDDKNIGRIIVEKTSSILPKVDTIGHKVLHANNELIYYILNLNDLPEKSKKDLVLLSIKIAQMGDNAGSHMLQLYYDLVDKCL